MYEPCNRASSTAPTWIGRILRNDSVSSGLILVLFRGIFQSEQEARELTQTFGCDCLMVSTQGQVATLGQVVVVDLKRTTRVGD